MQEEDVDEEEGSNKKQKKKLPAVGVTRSATVATRHPTESENFTQKNANRSEYFGTIHHLARYNQFRLIPNRSTDESLMNG